jgi:hypothetical protein
VDLPEGLKPVTFTEERPVSHRLGAGVAAGHTARRVQVFFYRCRTELDFRSILARPACHSSGTPALRRPAKNVSSNWATTAGTPKYTRLFRRAMLE